MSPKHPTPGDLGDDIVWSSGKPRRGAAETAPPKHKRQDKTAPVFVVATANDVSALPPEFLRAGRWDSMFFIDLPTELERVDITNIMLRKYKKDGCGINAHAVAMVTDQFSGAEIEGTVTSAMYRAFDAGREPTTDDLLHAAKATIPLSATMGDSLAALREWAKGRAIPASLPDGVVAEAGAAPASEYVSSRVFTRGRIGSIRRITEA